MKAIINGVIITEQGVEVNKVLVFDEKIEAITDEVPSGCEIIDAKGKWVSPGLVDIHIHGSCGYDTMDGYHEAIEQIAQGIAKNGVTAFLPTTMTMKKEAIQTALKCIQDCMNKDLKGASVVGAHLEGPFINASYKGAQSAKAIISPSMELINDYLDVIKVITIAPEIDQALDFIKEVKAKTAITCSMGHTNASYDEALKGIKAGISNVTHLFNAMTPLTHREPGAVGAALMSDVFTEIIADTIHIDPKMFSFIVKNKGEDRVVLVTDSMRAGCMENGVYDLGGQDVYVENGVARLSEGQLAGSVLTLNHAIKNMLDATSLESWQVIKMASLNPAKSIGIHQTKGSLVVGKDADITLFDEAFNCQATFVKGQMVYRQDEAQN